MQNALNSYNQAIDSGLAASKLGYDDTKTQAKTTQAEANRAAQKTYLDTVNPYGYNAQSLAAIGLANSGISESSRISAGNTYQNAVSQNQKSYDDTARQANLAYQQDVLNAGSSKAQYAGDLYKNQAETELSHNQWAQEQAQSASQWQQEFNQSSSQWAQEYALKVKELEDQIATNKITREQAQAELDIYRKYAAAQAAADIENTKANTTATLRG